MNDAELDLGQTLRGFAPGRENLFGRYTLKADPRPRGDGNRLARF